MNKSVKYSAPALEKGLEILEFLSAENSPLSQSEIANGVSRSSNEIYRMLVSLENRGYVIRDDVSGKYSLSLKLFTLSRTHSPVEQLRFAAQIPMLELAQQVGHACHLSVLYDGQLLVVSQVKSPTPVSLSIAEGTLFPLLSTVSGRVILSQLSHKEQLKHIVKVTGLEAADHENMLSQLENVKSTKKLLCESELTLGVTDCASFVGKTESGLVAAVAVSALSSALIKDVEKEALLSAVEVAAEKINVSLGL